MLFCPKCESLLRIGNSFYTTEPNPDTPDTPDIFVNLPMICMNSTCENFVGEDLQNPKHIVESVKNQVN
jgi:hypothetical protein